MRHLRLTAAVLAACLGVTAAAASVPNVPGPAAPKPPPKAPSSKVLFDAVDSGDISRVEELFRSGRYSVASFVDNEGNTALHLAAERCGPDPRRRIELIRFLISQGADIKARNKWGDTPANIARVKCGGPPVVSFMLTTGTVPPAPSPETVRRAEQQRQAPQAVEPQRDAARDQAMQMVQRGDQLRASGAYDQAVQAYEQAWHMDQTNASAFFGEGIAYFQLKKYAMAEWAFTTALQHDPNNQAAQSNLQVTQQQIAAANQRFQQTYQRTMQERAQDKSNEAINNALAGFQLGYNVGQASRPPPRPAPAPPQTAYRPPPNQQVATASPRPYSAPQSAAPAQAPALGPLPANCITLEKNAGGSFWSVINHCPAAVIGSMCFDNDNTFGCGKNIPAGFGPIRPGGKESIYGPERSATAWHAKACYYDDWNRGQCSFK